MVHVLTVFQNALVLEDVDHVGAAAFLKDFVGVVASKNAANV